MGSQRVLLYSKMANRGFGSRPAATLASTHLYSHSDPFLVQLAQIGLLEQHLILRTVGNHRASEL